MNIEQAPWCTPDCWISHYDFLPEVREGFRFPPQVRIHDATLRDGEQTPGVVFQVQDKVAIAKALDEAGVDRIEAGMPAVSPEDFQAIREIGKLGLKADIFGFCRGAISDVEKVVDCGLKHVIVEVPSGYPRLKYQFQWTPQEAIKRSVGAIQVAKKAGLYVVFFPYDTTRADLKLPLDFNSPVSGAFSSYSDHSPDAAWINLYVRPNHYLGAGHHHADAGMFHFSALGVDWFTQSPFHQNYDGRYFNLVQIDMDPKELSKGFKRGELKVFIELGLVFYLIVASLISYVWYLVLLWLTKACIDNGVKSFRSPLAPQSW